MPAFSARRESPGSESESERCPASSSRLCNACDSSTRALVPASTSVHLTVGLACKTKK